MSGSLLVLDQFNQLGGAQRCLLDLLPAFLQAGYVTHLAVPGDGALAREARRQGAVVHHIPCGPYTSGQKNWSDAARFAADLPRQASRIASLVSERIDLIYVNGPRLLPAAALGARGCPVILHAHSLLTHQTARLVQLALRSINAYLIAACQFVLEPLAAAVRPERSRVIYNGIAPIEFARRRRSAADPWRVGVIGRIAPEKGQLEFIQAARLLTSQLAARRQQCEFVVCGDVLFSSSRYSERVRAEAEGLPIDFIGWRDDIGEVLSTLDLVVVPSAMVDATPRVIPEAFSAGIPVVAFRCGGIPEIIEDGVTGVLCPPTAHDLAAKLLELLSDGGALLNFLSGHARTSFQATFSLERYRSEVLEAVRGAISQSNGRS
jgi:glycosyltransferase involved in cell wall biosynthesis